MIAIILPALYVIGLVFTLKTHKHRIDQEEADIEQNARANDTAGSVIAPDAIDVRHAPASCITHSSACE